MLLLVGDSHAIAMREAVTLLDGDLRDRLRGCFGEVAAGMLDTAGKLETPFHMVKHGRIAFNDEALHRRLDAIAGEPVVLDRNFKGIVGLSGCFHFTSLMKKTFWRRFSVMSVEGKHFLSQAVLSELMDRYATGMRRLTRDFASLGIKCFLIESPPIRRRYLPVLRPLSLEEVVSLNETLRESRRRFARRLDVPVIRVPDFVAEGGILKEQYESENDAQHANALYGVEMWREILRHAPALRRDRPVAAKSA